MKNLHRFFRLSASEKKFLFEVFLTVAFVRLALWILPFNAFKKNLQKILKNSESAKTDWQIIEKTCRMVRISSNFVPYASCLTQALSAFWLMKRLGQCAELKFGVSKERDSRIIAHAWLEIEGKIVLGKSARKYETLVVAGHN